jgi:hypothetical protein
MLLGLGFLEAEHIGLVFLQEGEEYAFSVDRPDAVNVPRDDTHATDGIMRRFVVKVGIERIVYGEYTWQTV